MLPYCVEKCNHCTGFDHVEIVKKWLLSPKALLYEPPFVAILRSMRSNTIVFALGITIFLVVVSFFLTCACFACFISALESSMFFIVSVVRFAITGFLQTTIAKDG